MTVKQLQTFILWLRKERISYSTLSAGGVTLDGVVDGKIERKADKPVERESMYQRYGGELFKAAATSPAAVVSDEERRD
jgi:hypothetical protein